MTKINGSGLPIRTRRKDFVRAFELTPNNIVAFIQKHIQYEGKFVFSTVTRQIGVGETAQRHRDLASEVRFAHRANSDFIAAFLIFGKEGDEITFVLAGSSEYFGKPSEKDMLLVGKCIAEMLKINSIETQVNQTSTGNVFIRGNLSGGQTASIFMPYYLLKEIPNPSS